MLDPNVLVKILLEALLGVWIILASGVASYTLVMYVLVGKSIVADAKKGLGAMFKRG